jgi:hypothetical protein
MEGYFVELALNEPKRWVDEAIAFCIATGKEIALAEFSNPYASALRRKPGVVMAMMAYFFSQRVQDRACRWFLRARMEDGTREKRTEDSLI